MPDQKKYRMKSIISSHMFRDEDLDYTARGILGYLSTQISRDGYPTVTPDEIPRAGVGRQKIGAVLDLLVALGYMEIVE